MSAVPALPYPVSATGTVFSGAGRYCGLSIGSTAGATVVLYDNTSASGTILAQFTLAAGGFQHIDIPHGARLINGVHLTSTAAIQGHVRIG